jgi:hypothetical protein
MEHKIRTATTARTIRSFILISFFRIINHNPHVSAQFKRHGKSPRKSNLLRCMLWLHNRNYSIVWHVLLMLIGHSSDACASSMYTKTKAFPLLYSCPALGKSRYIAGTRYHAGGQLCGGHITPMSGHYTS